MSEFIHSTAESEYGHASKAIITELNPQNAR